MMYSSGHWAEAKRQQTGVGINLCIHCAKVLFAVGLVRFHKTRSFS